MAIHSCPPHSSCSDACFWRSSNWRVPREHHWGCWRAASHWIKRTCVLDQTWIMHYFEWFLWTECIIHERQPTMVLLPWYFFLFYSRNVTVNLLYHYKFKPTVFIYRVIMEQSIWTYQLCKELRIIIIDIVSIYIFLHHTDTIYISYMKYMYMNW